MSSDFLRSSILSVIRVYSNIETFFRNRNSSSSLDTNVDYIKFYNDVNEEVKDPIHRIEIRFNIDNKYVRKIIYNENDIQYVINNCVLNNINILYAKLIPINDNLDCVNVTEIIKEYLAIDNSININDIIFNKNIDISLYHKLLINYVDNNKLTTNIYNLNDCINI